MPVSGLDVLTMRALSYAQSIADEVIAIHVATGQPQDHPSGMEGETGKVGGDDIGLEPNIEARMLAASWASWIDLHLGHDAQNPRPELATVLSPTEPWCNRCCAICMCTGRATGRHSARWSSRSW